MSLVNTVAMSTMFMLTSRSELGGNDRLRSCCPTLRTQSHEQVRSELERTSVPDEACHS